MKKFFSLILHSLLHLFICIIYAFLISSMIISLFDLNFCYFDELFTVIFVGSYFLPPSSDVLWR